MDDVPEQPDIPGSVTGLTTAWLGMALAELPDLQGATVEGFTEIGSGYGLAGSAARVELRSRSTQPSAVVLKLTDRKSGVRELTFYRDVAAHTSCRVARCYGGWVHADHDADRAALVLEALPVQLQGDVLTGATVEQAHTVLETASAFHAAFAHDPPPLPRLTYDVDAVRRRSAERVAVFLDRYADTLPAGFRARVDALSARLDTAPAVLAAAPETLVHTDFHLDNVLFLDGGEAAVLDWPGARVGAAAVDVGRFLVEGIADELVPEHAALVAHYRKARERAGVPVGPDFEAELNAALDLQLAYTIDWAGTPNPAHDHPRIPRLLDALSRRTALLETLRS